MRAADPAQGDAVAAQLAALRRLTPAQVGLSLWERVFAISFHVLASLLVLRAVRAGRPRWWLAAVGLHVAVNGIAVTAAPAAGTVGTAAGLTLGVLAFLAGIRAQRRADGPEPAELVGA